MRKPETDHRLAITLLLVFYFATTPSYFGSTSFCLFIDATQDVTLDATLDAVV